MRILIIFSLNPYCVGFVIIILRFLYPSTINALHEINCLDAFNLDQLLYFAIIPNIANTIYFSHLTNFTTIDSLHLVIATLKSISRTPINHSLIY